MLAIAVFLQKSNQNLLLGFIPESLGLLLFGVGLIVLTVVLRGLFRRFEKTSGEERIEN